MSNRVNSNDVRLTLIDKVDFDLKWLTVIDQVDSHYVWLIVRMN